MEFVRVIFNKLYESAVLHIIGFSLISQYIASLITKKDGNQRFYQLIIMFIMTVALVIYYQREEIQMIVRKKHKGQKKIKSSIKPSHFPLYIMGLLQEPENREFVISDTEERFAKDIKKRGLRWAKCMLWRDTLIGLYSAIGAKTVKGLRWVGFGYLIEKILLK